METEEKPPDHHLMACDPLPKGGIFRIHQSTLTDITGERETDAMGCIGSNMDPCKVWPFKQAEVVVYFQRTVFKQAEGCFASLSLSY